MIFHALNKQGTWGNEFQQPRWTLRTRSAFTGSFSAGDVVQNSLQIRLPDVALGSSIWIWSLLIFHFMPRSTVTDTSTSVHTDGTQQGDRQQTSDIRIPGNWEILEAKFDNNFDLRIPPIICEQKKASAIWAEHSLNNPHHLEKRTWWSNKKVGETGLVRSLNHVSEFSVHTCASSHRFNC
jgi:hypothetical protein